MVQLGSKSLEDINILVSRKFLENVFGDANGNILTTVLDKSKDSKDNVIKHYTKDNVASIKFYELASYNNKGCDIYYATNTRSGNSNSKEDVLQVCEIFEDIDGKDFKGGKVEAYKFLQETINKYQLVPTYLIDSGNGYHLHFVLRVPIQINNPDDIKKVEKISMGIAKLFHADHLWYVSALSRIPGFYNNKDKEAPKLIEVVSYNPSQKYDLSDLEKYSEEVSYKDASCTVKLESVPPEIPEKFYDLLDQDPPLKARWNGIPKSKTDTSGSAIDQSVANILALRGLTREDIATILYNAPYPKRTERDEPYMERTLNKAFEKVSDDSSIASLDKYKNAIPFPLDVFPSEVQDALRAIAKSVSCPTDFAGLPFITLAGTAIGRTRELAIWSSWTEPPIIFSATVGISGSGKTPALNLISSYFRKKQQELGNEYKTLYKQYLSEEKVYKKQHREWLNSDSPDLSTEPKEPVEPLCKQLSTSDLTYESLVDILSDNPRGIAEISDELAGFFNSHNQYKGKGNDRQRWLQLWNSHGQITYNRKGQDTIILSDPLVCIFGNIVPSKLTAIKDGAGEDGMLPRFLFSFPERMDLVYNKDGVAKEHLQIIEAIYERLFELEPEDITQGYMEPLGITFTKDAQELWDDHMENHIDEINYISKYEESLSEAWAKFGSYSARLALIMHGIRYGCGEVTEFKDVDHTSLESAIKLVTYFKTQIYKVINHIKSGYQQNKLDLACERIRSEVKKENRPYTLRDAVTNKLCGVRTSKEAQDLFDQLHAEGYGEPETIGTTTVFTLHPEH